MNETAFKERLKVIAVDNSLTFNQVWKQLLLERFLARLSKSNQKEHFVFKGGLLLANYITIGRETIDIDFLMKKIKNESPQIEKACHEITSVNINDGFHFELFEIEELYQPHMEYTGWRLNFTIQFGKMKDRIQVDVGVGDTVKPEETKLETYEYKGHPLFEGEVSLLAYPPEYIFSEKLETIISKGGINSRMKDYHDILVMTREREVLKSAKLKKAISDTFETRGTRYKFPIEFSTDEMANLQSLWKAHLKGLGSIAKQLEIPDELSMVITEINTYLGEISK